MRMAPADENDPNWGPALHLLASARAGTGRTDALSDLDAATAWFARTAVTHPGFVTGQDLTITRERLDDLRLVRGAVEQILLGEPRASSLAVVNRYDTESAPSWGLALDGSGSLVVRRRVWGSGVDSWLGAVAADCIELVRTGVHERLSTCATPSCAEVFVPQHHRRRYCTQACAHRSRQARFHDRHRTEPKSLT